MSRSSGPSKLPSLTGYASSDDSNSGNSVMTGPDRGTAAGGSIAQPHRLAHGLQLAGRLGTRLPRSLEQDLAEVARPRGQRRAPLAERLEHLLARGRQLRLHPLVADPAGATARLHALHPRGAPA